MGADRLRLLADPAVRSAMSRELGREIEHYDAISSTQDRARELADAGHPGALVVAERQSTGRGRQGRSWLAEPGTALLASWLFRPLPADPALFALLSGVAVARALNSLGVPDARLKWPNDVQLAGKKVAGVLADAVTGASGGALVLGIGINVHQADLGELAATATSLARERHTIDRLALLARVDGELERIARDAHERVRALDEWRARSSTLGTSVEVRSAAGAVRGFARSIGDDGALVLDTASGSQRVLAGEVFAT